MRELQCYDWPGNVRELQHVLERACIIAVDGRLRFDLSPASSMPTSPTPESATSPRILTDQELRTLEASNIRAALLQCQGKVYGANGAAALLGMKPTTLNSRIKALGIRNA